METVLMKYSELKKILRQHGCFKTNEGGNHEIWFSPISKQSYRSADITRSTSERESRMSSLPLSYDCQRNPVYLVYTVGQYGDILVVRDHYYELPCV